MKSITFTLSLCVATGGLLLAGCSKHQDSRSSTGSAENTPTADSPAASSGDSAEMKIKWPIGKKYSMQIDLAQNVTTKVPSLPEPVKQVVNMTQGFDISALKELPNGGRELEMEFKGLTIAVHQGENQVMSFDSNQSAAQDGENPIAPLLHKMVGAHIRYLTDADGKVEKVEGTEELLSRIGYNPKSQTHAMFKQMFGEDTLRQYGSFGEMMPNRVVKVGESWAVKREFPTAAGNLAVDMKFTFKGWEQQGNHKCARIETHGTLSSASGSPGNTNVKIDDGKTSGTIWFDPELGMVVSQDMQQNMTLKVMAGGQTLTPKLDQKIHVAIVE
jgi:hypothetical protein